MSDEIEYVDELPAHTRRGPSPVWPKRLAPLLERPGKWAVLKQGSQQAVGGARARLKNGTLKLPEGTVPSDWEFVTRTKDEKGVLYGRYVGGAK